MQILDATLRQVLSQSGWSEERQVDISQWVTILEEAGFEMNQPSRDILRSIGGLTVAPALLETRAYQPTVVHFDPLRLQFGFRRTPWEEYLGTTLSPLGECEDDTSIYVGNDGRLYGSWDSLFECCGNDTEDSLKTLLLADKKGTRLTLS